MSFVGNALTDAFKLALLEGRYDFRPGGSVFKLALYTKSAALNAQTSLYTASGEVDPSGTYVTGGLILTPSTPQVISGVALVTFQNLSITGASFSARGALIYESSSLGSVAVLDFGADKVATPAAPFVVRFGPPGSQAPIQLAGST